ncbi:MAG: methyltransferase domain-containing protein [Rudaea sp.]
MSQSLPVSSSPLRVNLGCGRNFLEGWVNLDWKALPGVDVVADLNACATTPLPFDDDQVDEFLLSHVIEHVPNTLAMMQELHRIARPGAIACIRVPHGNSDDAWEDPTHVRPYFPGSFGYFSQPYYWRADYGYRGDWLPRDVTLHVPAHLARGDSIEVLYERLRMERNLVVEMVATLEAVKPIRAPLRELQVAMPTWISVA